MDSGFPAPDHPAYLNRAAGRALAEPYLRWLQKECREDKSDLKERVHELDCLFAVDRALRRPDKEWKGSLQAIADALPRGFRVPQQIGVRLQVGDQEFTSEGYAPSRWTLTRRINSADDELGELQAILSEPPAEGAEPFTADEGRLMTGVSDRLGEAMGRIQAEQDLRASEGFMRALIEAAPVALFCIDSEGLVVNWNPAAERVFGWSADEVIHASLPFLSPGQEEEFTALRERAAAGEALYRLQFTCRRRDGTPLDMILSISPVRVHPDSVTAVLFAVEDFADEAGAWDQIRFQSRLLEAVGQAIIATDLEGRVIYWNRVAESLYGWSSGEAMDRDIMELTPSERAGETAADVMERLKRGESWTGELAARRKDGTTFRALVSNSPILDEHERLLGIIGVSSDLSRVKDLEAQLRQSQKMEAVGRLAGGIAHDFNNLLTVIQGQAEMVMDDLPLGSELRSGLTEVITQTRRAGRLTRPLLALSRRDPVIQEVMDLGKALANIKSLLQRLIPSRISLNLGQDGAIAFIHADPSQVDQVILNLAVNAVHAIDGPGSLSFSVDECEISPAETEVTPWEVVPGAYARLTVTDSGCGIPAGIVGRIFEPYFTTKPEGEGTGLGLSTILEIMKQGGGTVVVDTEPGRGTSFHVLWPQVKPPEPQAAAGSGDADTKEAARSVGSPRKVVLLVDDSAAVQAVARKILERSGYQVLSAADGREALALSEEHANDIGLVLSDVVMPVMGGGDLLGHLNEIHPHLPVVLMSGYSDEELPQDLRSRADGFLGKPFGPRELLGAVGAQFAG